MKITYNGLELYSTKTFLIDNLGEVNIDIGDERESIRCILNIAKDEKNKELQYSTNVIDDHTIKLNLINWNDTFGRALKENYEVGTLFERKLYFNFLVTKIGVESEIREILFNVYLGEEN